MYSLQLTLKLDRMQEKINALENEIEILKKNKYGDSKSLNESIAFDRNISDVSSNDTRHQREPLEDDSLNLSIVSKKYLEQLNKR